MNVTRNVFRDDHEMYRETVRRFLERECKPRQADWDRAGQVDRETWLKAGREGLLCASLPEDYGGGGGEGVRLWRPGGMLGGGECVRPSGGSVFDLPRRISNNLSSRCAST